MITYDIDFNLQDGEILEDVYYNAKELRGYGVPKRDLSSSQLKRFVDNIPNSIRYQFRITGWDNDVIEDNGLPMLLYSTNMEDWVNE